MGGAVAICSMAQSALGTHAQLPMGLAGVQTAFARVATVDLRGLLEAYL